MIESSIGLGVTKKQRFSVYQSSRKSVLKKNK